MRGRTNAPARPKLADLANSPVLIFDISKAEPKTKEMNQEITVPEVLKDPHVIIERTLNERKRFRGKEFYSSDETILQLNIGKESLARAFCIIDTVAKELEKRGATIFVRKRHEIVAKFGLEEIPFHLSEKSNLLLIEGTEEEKKEYLYRPRREYERTGRLSLVIDGWADSMRTHFQDGARQRVEGTIGEFLGTIMLILELHKKRREAWRLDEIESQKRQESVRQENAKVEFLNAQLRLLERAELIERYLESIRQDSEREAEKTWTVWVKNYLERVKQAARRAPLEDELSKLGYRQPTCG